MKEIIVLIVCLLLMVIVFLSLKTRAPLDRKTMPENLETRFREYCEYILAKLNINVKSVELKRYKLLIEVPFEDGQFEFYSFDYRIETEKAVADSKGMVLNTTELFAKCGYTGTPILVFFRRDDEMFEISFVEDKVLAQKGYKGYVNFRYGSLNQGNINEEYSLILDNKKIRLWENLKGEAPFEHAVQTREHVHGILSSTAEYTDTWEGKDVQVTTWVQFEKKRELVYWIKTTNPTAETIRGIHVGSTVEELKNKYPEGLGYSKDFKGSGPCYGYVPDDNTYRYIAFFATAGKITQIWITDGFSERPFEAPDGYIDDDVEWIRYDSSDKLSEKYAREIYVGQHKSDFDPDKVLQSFIAKELVGINVLETGALGEEPGRRNYYIKCQSKDGEKKLILEVQVKRVKLEHSLIDTEIWIVDQYRSQKKANL